MPEKKEETPEQKRKRLYYLKLKAKRIKMPEEVAVPNNSGDMVVITKTKNLISYIFKVTAKSPQKFRFTFVNRMQNIGLDAIQFLYKANDIKIVGNKNQNDIMRRYQFQSAAMTNIKLLEYVSMLALENECILLKQYEQIAKQGAECMILLNNWIESDKRRINNGA